MELDFNGYSNDSKVIEYIKAKQLPIVIGGNGSVGNAVAKKLRVNNIYNFAMVSLKIDEGNRVVFLEKIPYEHYVLLYGYLGMYAYDPKDLLKPFGCDNIQYFSELYDAELVDYEFYAKHANEFDNTYNLLADELSKKSMRAFLNSKINKNALGLAQFTVKPQYFGIGFFTNKEKEVFMDCGAYDGDTIKDFLKWSKGSYSRIIAFEPDEKNKNKLEQFIKDANLRNVTVIPCGAYSKKTELMFKNEKEMSRISELEDTEQCTVIKTDTIDNVACNLDVTFIKMDIEGAELLALQGAEETIKRCRPTLAISAYHRKEDLFALPQYIKKCYDGYNFYFRLHKELPVDAVLYAIP